MLTGPNTSLPQAHLVSVVLGYNAAFRFTHCTVRQLSFDGVVPTTILPQGFL